MPTAPALFCRAAQQNFLRLASTPAIFTAYQAALITNHDALAALQAFDALPQVDRIDEPISSGTRLISLDQDFRQFLEAGLDLVLLEADGEILSKPTDPPG